jgi:hypothetical protein
MVKKLNDVETHIRVISVVNDVRLPYFRKTRSWKERGLVSELWTRQREELTGVVSGRVK